MWPVKTDFPRFFLTTCLADLSSQRCRNHCHQGNLCFRPFPKWTVVQRRTPLHRKCKREKSLHILVGGRALEFVTTLLPLMKLLFKTFLIGGYHTTVLYIVCWWSRVDCTLKHKDVEQNWTKKCCTCGPSKSMPSSDTACSSGSFRLHIWKQSSLVELCWRYSRCGLNALAMWWFNVAGVEENAFVFVLQSFQHRASNAPVVSKRCSHIQRFWVTDWFWGGGDVTSGADVAWGCDRTTLHLGTSRERAKWFFSASLSVAFWLHQTWTVNWSCGQRCCLGKNVQRSKSKNIRAFFEGSVKKTWCLFQQYWKKQLLRTLWSIAKLSSTNDFHL